MTVSSTFIYKIERSKWMSRHSKFSLMVQTRTPISAWHSAATFVSSHAGSVTAPKNMAVSFPPPHHSHSKSLRVGAQPPNHNAFETSTPRSYTAFVMSMLRSYKLSATSTPLGCNVSGGTMLQSCRTVRRRPSKSARTHTASAGL